MSHDFPDGPDYNPEKNDDDPWDVPAFPEPGDWLWVQIEAPPGHHPRWRWALEPTPDATESDLPQEVPWPIARRSAIYWFKLRHKSTYHRAFAVAAIRLAKEKRPPAST